MHSTQRQYYPQMMHKRIHLCKFVVLTFIDGRTLNKNWKRRRKKNTEHTQFSVQTKETHCHFRVQWIQILKWDNESFRYIPCDNNKLPFKTKTRGSFIESMIEFGNILLLFSKCKIKNQREANNNDTFRYN